jgi:hypothetical protein
MRKTSLLATAPLLVSAALGACRVSTPSAPTQDATSQALPVAAAAAPVFGPKTIDAELRAEWARIGVTPTPPADDARFLRRVYLDVVGTVPPAAVARDFLADTRPDKRAQLVDKLLASPAYAAYWATSWEDTLVGWNTREQVVDRGALREWLESAFLANMPWDQMVTGLMTAKGQNSRGGKRQDDAPAPMTDSVQNDANAPKENFGVPINGAVNWFLKYRDAPQDLAGNASRLFLGVQIQCAQCHDHKTEKWKQDDFRRFAACFARTRTDVLDQGKTMGKKRAMVVELGRPLPRYAKNPDLDPIAKAEPTTLDGKDIGLSPDTRAAVAAWMTSKQNPWFAKAIVNRMWAHFLGRGFVDPVDDIRDSNPATMPALFNELADDFTAHGDDLKALIRTITATEAYQLSPTPAGETGMAEKSALQRDAGTAEDAWSHFHIAPLGPNELLRSILDVTDLEGVLAQRKANLDRIRFQIYQRYTFLFDVDEEFAETQFEGTVSQALSLLNGPLVGGGTSAIPGGELDAVLKSPGTERDRISALYWLTLTRAPSPEELAYWTHYVTEPHPVETVKDVHGVAPPPPLPAASARAGQKKKGLKGGPPPSPDALTRLEARDLDHPNARRQAFEDLFWALLNSSEFTFNH